MEKHANSLPNARKFRAEVNQRFAKYLRKAREAKAVTQLDLSLMLGRGPKYVWRLENCYSEADIFEFIEIMEILEVPPEEAIWEVARR